MWDLHLLLPSQLQVDYDLAISLPSIPNTILDPETANFLTESERDIVLADLPEQAPTMKAKTINFEQVKELFRSSTFIPFLMIWITHGIGGWGISFVLPTVIYELGISNTAISQVMTMV